MLHISMGLAIFAAFSLVLGFMMAAAQQNADEALARAKRDRSVFRMTADLLFFWLSEDFRYVVAYPWLILALTVGVANIIPGAWPNRVLHCDGDLLVCVNPPEWRG